ncbi:hypothetical protein GCM10009733_061660 [Nonomuraea maheshkhaliensis]|uniref:ATP-grasp-modified RiPP n=1 Tax=Nonomuraea maheshkhaliensis TaxID=419590 RepID=A0ABN2FPJ9_9ACTN
MRTSTKQDDQSALDLITHSPDGESRGTPFRAGDFFPMSPTEHILSAAGTPAGEARPWGLRHLVAPAPVAAGNHGGGRSNETSETSSDGTVPSEEQVKD